MGLIHVVQARLRERGKEGGRGEERERERKERRRRKRGWRRRNKSFLRPGLRTGATSLLPYSTDQSKSQDWPRFNRWEELQSHIALGMNPGKLLTGAINAIS